MLYKDDNPKLFKILYIECLKNGESLQPGTTFLTDSQLRKIKKLDLKEYYNYDLDNLKGIENLTNLEKLDASGISFTNYFEDVIHHTEDYFHGTSFQSFLEHVDKLEKHQIKDITPLYRLKNLKFLTLDNQRYITEINLKYFPRLEGLSMQKCSKLETIKGLNDIGFNKELESYNVLDFSGCAKLSRVDGFPEFVKGMEKVLTEHFYGKVVFPTKTYCYLKNHYKSNFKIDDPKVIDLINWSEISTFYVRNDFDSRQMELTKKKVDSIISSVCKNAKTDIEKIYKVYEWICKNIKYDTEGITLEENLGIGYSDIRDNNFISNKIRSSYKALWDKKAVCTGISALLNFMLSDIGFKTDSVCCLTKYYNPNNVFANMRITPSDHEISSIDLNGERYFMDPTYDLYTKPNDKMHSFLLNRIEVDKYVYLRYYDNNAKVAPSLQSKLAAQGFNIGFNINKTTGKYEYKYILGYNFGKSKDTISYLEETADRRDQANFETSNGKRIQTMLNQLDKMNPPEQDL